MKSLYEQMGGKYGRLRRTFLKEHHNGIYTAMLMDGSLWDHLHEIDQSCKERLDRPETTVSTRRSFPSSRSGVRTKFGYGVILSLIRRLIASASACASCSPIMFLSSSMPKNRVPPMPLAKALTQGG